MKNLNKKEIQLLNDILGNLNTAQKFISKQEVKIINTAYKTGLKEDVYSNGVEGGISISKEIGSDIVYLKNAIHKLEMFLTPAL